MEAGHLRERFRLAREYRIELWAGVTLIGWSKYVYYTLPDDFDQGIYAIAGRVVPPDGWALLTFLLGCGLLLSLLVEYRWPRVILAAASSATFLCLAFSLLFSPFRPPGWIMYAGFGLACADAALRGPRRMPLL